MQRRRREVCFSTIGLETTFLCDACRIVGIQGAQNVSAPSPCTVHNQCARPPILLVYGRASMITWEPLESRMLMGNILRGGVEARRDHETVVLVY